MNYEIVKSWVIKNYQDIKVIDRNDNVSEKLELELNGGGLLKVDFSNLIQGHACIVYDNERDTVYSDYSAIIVINNHSSDRINILSLLHELGHHTECQAGDVLYKEVMAWKGCVKHLETLGIDIEYISFVRECLESYENSYLTKVDKHYHILLKNNGFMTEKEFYQLYSYKNNPSKFYGFENWRKPWKRK